MPYWRDVPPRGLPSRDGDVVCQACDSGHIDMNGYCTRCYVCIDCCLPCFDCNCTLEDWNDHRSGAIRYVSEILEATPPLLMPWESEILDTPTVTYDLVNTVEGRMNRRTAELLLLSEREARRQLEREARNRLREQEAMRMQRQTEARMNMQREAWDEVPIIWCQNCPREIPLVGRENAHYCEEHNVWRCTNCGPCENESADLEHARRSTDEYGVHRWNYRPRHFRPKGNWRTADGGETLMGVELEVGGRRSHIIADAVREIDAEQRHLYLKNDGSLAVGCEIVTHPMTLAWAREYPFAEMLTKLRDRRCRVDEGYGLHVHVSRNAFRQKGRATQSRTHQMLWLMFLYRNQKNLSKLGRRQESSYATWAKPQKGELKRKACGVRYDIHGDNDSRYVAVNCNNERTFELRFFKSTLDEREFYAAIEFADASVRYTKSLNALDVLRGQGLTWDRFTKWVQRHNYQNLHAEITDEPKPRKPRKKREETSGTTTAAVQAMEQALDDATAEPIEYVGPTVTPSGSVTINVGGRDYIFTDETVSLSNWITFDTERS